MKYAYSVLPAKGVEDVPIATAQVSNPVPHAMETVHVPTAVALGI